MLMDPDPVNSIADPKRKHWTDFWGGWFMLEAGHGQTVRSGDQ